MGTGAPAGQSAAPAPARDACQNRRNRPGRRLESRQRPDGFNSRKLADTKAWLKLWGNGPKPHLIENRQVSGGQTMIDATHGSFDNNIEVVDRTLRRIIGRPLAIPVGNLHGF